MSKYIEYDAIDYRFDRIQDQSPDFIGGVIYANACVVDAPSIDIVFCKECKHRKKYPCDEIEFYECNHLRLHGTKVGVEDDWFCADGERKEGE